MRLFLLMLLRALLLAALVALVVVAERQFEWSALLEPECIQAWLEPYGSFAPLILMAAMAAAVVVSPIPSVPLDVAAGLVFGPIAGTLYATLGALMGSVISFLLARLVGREPIEKLLGGHIQFCRMCSNHLLFGVVLGSRLVPVLSFDVVSYGAGLTAMSVGAFALATFLGMLPLTFVYVSFGGSVVASPVLAVSLGVALVAGFFALPRWIERSNPFGLKRLFDHAEGGDERS